MADFFISYTRADRSWAEWIDWQLRDAGYATIVQAFDFRPGSNFVVEMHRAAREAERTIAVLSPDFLRSEFTEPEWAAAFASDPKGKGRQLVPVRVRKCEPRGLLAQIVYIDLVGAADGGTCVPGYRARRCGSGRSALSRRPAADLERALPP